MPKTRRLYLPHGGFHITARTQGGADWFVPEMRASIVVDIEEAVGSFGHVLLAYAVMKNHFHIVLQQGSTPLGWCMQRIMQRTVERVRRTHGIKQGHIFGQPYWSGGCANPVYLRRAIVYTHMNPVKARICSRPEQYEWTSHNNYMSAPEARSGRRWDPIKGLVLFANENAEAHAIVADYAVFNEYALERLRSGVPGDWMLPYGANRLLLPRAAHGDGHWAAHYSAFVEAKQFTRAVMDVTAHATSLLELIDPNLDLDTLRMAGRSKAASTVRRQLIAGLIAKDCRRSTIARCLRVSPALVSMVGRQMRFGDAG